jgi:phosphatidylglycerol:prolipoprotein diacylglycerol transferase
VAGGYVHDIDPVLADLGAIHIWWYGLGFALGFFQLHRFLMRDRGRPGLSRRDVWALSVLLVAGVLAGGRVVEIAFDEWPFYREHPHLIPAYWLGGMATHGLLFGAAAATALFCLLWQKPFLSLADALVIRAP